MNRFEKDLEAFVNQMTDQVGHDGNVAEHDGDSGSAPGMTKRVVALESGTVLLEAKDGAWREVGEEVVMEIGS